MKNTVGCWLYDTCISNSGRCYNVSCLCLLLAVVSTATAALRCNPTDLIEFTGIASCMRLLSVVHSDSPIFFYCPPVVRSSFSSPSSSSPSSSSFSTSPSSSSLSPWYTIDYISIYRDLLFLLVLLLSLLLGVLLVLPIINIKSLRSNFF